MLKRRTPVHLAKVMNEAVVTTFAVQSGEKPTQETLAAKAGRLGVVVPEFEAWVDEVIKLRSHGYGQEQTLKSLPVVTGGKVRWAALEAKEAKMAAVKKTTAKKTAGKGQSKTAKKAASKSGRGKAVVVYFSADNLSVLAAAKKYAAKQDEAMAAVVIKALVAFLK